jgi:hypothetical protein
MGFFFLDLLRSDISVNRNNRIKKTTNNVGTISKSNIKIVERGKMDTAKKKYMNTHFPGLVQALQ